MTGSKRVVHWTVRHDVNAVRLQVIHRAPPAADYVVVKPKEDLRWAWNRDRRAVWDQVGLSHCRHNSLVTVREEACLRQGHNDQSHGGHQCSETTLTGESGLHISTPPGIEPGSLITGSKRVVHWTSETRCDAVRLQALHNIEKHWILTWFLNCSKLTKSHKSCL